GFLSDSWPMFGGSPDRSRISSASGRPGARLYGIEFVRPKTKPRANNQPMNENLQHLEELAQTEQFAGLTLGVMPVVDRGELFFQDGARLYAVSLESGVPLPGWVETYGGSRNGQYTVDASPLPRNQQLTVTLTDHSVLAVMGQPDRLAMRMGMPRGADSATRLVCLDRATGKEKWSIFPRRLPDEATALRSLDFSGSPLVIGDNVYVIGRGGKGQFEDCHVVCLDIATGAYRWSCYIASASGANPMWGGVAGLEDTVSHLAYASGRLYVLTNLGALASVDAYNGTILWLNIYPRDAAARNPNVAFRGRIGRGGTVQNFGKPWTHSPVVVQDGRVFILPGDSDHLLVYDAGSGVEVQRISQSDLGTADTLLAVIGERLVVAGERNSGARAGGTVLCINWRKYKADDFDKADDEVIFWPATLSSPIRGRGFVTNDSVFIPTNERLIRIHLEKGKVEQTYPEYPRTWEEGEGRGNVLVTQDHVVIAGADGVDVYTDLTIARGKLDREVAALPNAPEPRLRYAEIMFAAGQIDLATQKLDEAITLLGGPGQMSAGAGRDRVFNDALTFAQKLAREDNVEQLDLASRLFERAAAAAASPAQQVSWRVSRAKLAHRQQNFENEVRLFQEILSDPALRTVGYTDADAPGVSQAAALAEKTIDEVVRRAGTNVYSTFERQASAALEAASAAKDAQKLLEIALVYPNAASAPRALLTAADIYESAGNHRKAAQVLRQIYFRYPESGQKLRILEAMARNDLALPGRTDAAIARLSQGARHSAAARLDRPLTMPDGKVLRNVSFSQAADALRQYNTQVASARLPTFALPTIAEEMQHRATTGKKIAPFAPETADSVIPNVASLMVPQREFARHDRVVAWSAPATLNVYAVGTATPAASSKSFPESPAGCAWLSDGLLVWTGKELTLLEPDTLIPRWKAELKALPDAEVVEAPSEADEDGNEDAAVDLGLRRQQEVQNRLRRNVMIRGGAARPIALPAPARIIPGGAEQFLDVRPAGDRVVASTSTGRVVALDMSDGKLAWQARPGSAAFDRLLVSDDFTVAKTAPNDTSGVQLIVFDTLGGQALLSKSFGAAGGTFPVNVALSPDGTLVYTLPDRICVRAMFETGDAGYKEAVVAGEGNPTFVGAVGAEQLVVSEGRILALADNGQFIRMHALEDAKPLRIRSPESKSEVDAVLPTGARNWSVSLRIVGPRLYVVGQQSLMAYNLDVPEDRWQKPVFDNASATTKEAFIGRDYVVLLDEVSGKKVLGDLAVVTYRLNAFSRQIIAGRGEGDVQVQRESGMYTYDPEIADPAGLV
ncbi:MAG: PQQ-binding-like beta-propeller repeat protein, partial [Tepidisphaeraceae bacterium]